MFKKFIGLTLAFILAFSLVITAASCTKDGKKVTVEKENEIVSTDDESETDTESDSEKESEKESEEPEEEEIDYGDFMTIPEYISSVQGESLINLVGVLDDDDFVSVPEYYEAVKDIPLIRLLGAYEEFKNIKDILSSPLVQHYLIGTEITLFEGIDMALGFAQIENMTSIEEACDYLNEIMPYDQLVETYGESIAADKAIFDNIAHCFEILDGDDTVDAVKEELGGYIDRILEYIDEEDIAAIATLTDADFTNKAEFKEFVLSFVNAKTVDSVIASIEENLSYDEFKAAILDAKAEIDRLEEVVEEMKSFIPEENENAYYKLLEKYIPNKSLVLSEEIFSEISATLDIVEDITLSEVADIAEYFISNIDFNNDADDDDITVHVDKEDDNDLPIVDLP